MNECLRRLVLPCAALLSVLTLSSCLEQYSEDMVIHSDLSGEAIVTVTLPDTLLDKYDKVQTEFSDKNIRKRFESLSGVTLEAYSLSEGRHPEAVFHVKFTSLDKLSEAVKGNAPAQILVGLFTTRRDGDYTIVERKLGVGSPLMSMPTDKNALYKMHFDMPVEVAHTDSGFFDKSHGDLRYRWTMANLVAEQPTLVNKLIKPLPWLWIVTGTAAVVAVAWLLWKQMGNAKKKRLYAPPQSVPMGSPEAPPETLGPRSPQRPGTPQRPGPPRRPGPPGNR